MAKTVKINGIIGWEFTEKDLASQMDNVEESYQIILHSPGGLIVEGFAIYNFLQRFKEEGGKFEVVVDFAGSMTSVIAMASDKVVMRKDSSLMFIHRVQGCACGDADNLFKTGEDMLKLEELLKNIYLNKAGDKIDEEELLTLMKDETYLTAEESQRYGFADIVIKDKKQPKALLNLGCGISIDLDKIAATRTTRQSLQGDITVAESIKDLEGVLRDAGRLSRRDTKALVSRLSSLVQRDAGLQQTKNLIERLKSISSEI